MIEFVTNNFAPFVGVILLITILFEDEQLAKEKKRSFLVAAFLFALELVIRNAEYYAADGDTYTIWRAVWSALLYISRTAVLYVIIGTEMNLNQKKSRTVFAVVAIPLILMVFIAFSVFFTDTVYSFSKDNHFHTGPLGFLRYVPLILYFVFTVFLIIRDTRRLHTKIIVLGYECLFLVVTAMGFEFFGYPAFMCEAAMILGIVFFFMYFQTNELLRENTTLAAAAYMDGLTDVYNRAGYEALVESNRTKWTNVGFLIMDIDHFKDVNDNYGHDAGDRILKRVAEILTSTFRSSDHVIRFGGDEFVVLLPGVTEENGEAIRKKIDSVNILLDNLIDDLPKTSVSAGVAFSREGVTKELYTNADKAMYEIKSTTRRGCRIFAEPQQDK